MTSRRYVTMWEMHRSRPPAVTRRRNRLTSDRMPLGTWRILTIGASLALGGALLATLVVAAGSRDLALDFRDSYLPAAQSLLDVGSPYAINDRSPDGISGVYLYPPQLAFALVPVTVLSTNVAAFVAFLVALAALMGALALLGVRDIRCFAILLVWAPAWQALQMANVSALLVLALALVWRYRDHVWRSGAVLGLAASLKLFLWPMLVWALASSRPRVAGCAVAVGFSVTIVSWAAIGFDGLTAYPDLLRSVGEQPSYSIGAVVENLGYAPIVGYVLSSVVGWTLLALAVVLARRGDDVRAFTLAIAAALALTPILWWHYLALLVVPLALTRPRFSPIWLLPIAIWLSRLGAGDGVETAVPLLVAVILFAVMLTRATRPSPVWTPRL
jgi:Glycosyltransferase family 87